MKQTGLSKKSVILLSVIITIVFVLFSVPSFMSKKKIDDLVNRMENYEEEKPLGEMVYPNKNSDKIKDKDKNKENDLAENIKEPSMEELYTEEMDNVYIQENPTVKTFTAYFNGNGAEAEVPSLSCTTTSHSCRVILPTVLGDRTMIGWSMNANQKTASLYPGQTIILTQNRTFYAITRKDVTIGIYGNGAFSGSVSRSCSYFNQETGCSIQLPDLDNDYYTTVGFTTSSVSDELYYHDHETIFVSHSMNLYGLRKVDTSSYYRYADVAQDMYQRINRLRISEGVSPLSWSKSLELSAMLRVSEVARDYFFNVNGNHHYRISNRQSFQTVNTMAKGENFYAKYTPCDANYFQTGFEKSSGHYKNMVSGRYTSIGIGLDVVGDSCYIVELFG